MGDKRDLNSEKETLEILEDLQQMSFEDLMKLKEELGAKVYNEAVFGDDTKYRKEPKANFNRENKNRPREMSSKRPVPLIVEKKSESAIVHRDPRFDNNCGEYKKDIFKKNYEFITDIRRNEIDELKKKLKKNTDADEVAKIKFLIQRLENLNREEERRKIKQEKQKEQQKQIQTAREEGKRPYYIKKSEQRAKELVEKYVEIKESGKLARHLEKRRKKNACKDRKKLKFD